MIAKLLFISFAFSAFDANWCESSWYPSFGKPKSSDELSQKVAIDEKVKPKAKQEETNKFARKRQFKFWGNSSLVQPIDSDDETMNLIDDGSPNSSVRDNNSLRSVTEKSVVELENDALFLEQEAQNAEIVAQLKRNEAEEAKKRAKKAEQIEYLHARKTMETKAFVVAGEDESEETLQRSKNARVVVEKSQTKLKDVQQSARLAEARAIKEDIIAKKEQKEAEARARKEYFEAERKADLKISDAPRIAAAEACFMNENEGTCEQSGCRWNGLIKACDVDCERINGKAKNGETECHSAIGIRKRFGDDREHEEIVADKNYEISRICSFDSRKKRCLWRAGRFF